MADTTVGATSGAAATTPTQSACEISKQAVDAMKGSSVSPTDAGGASKQMDFAQLKGVLDKMKACQQEIEQKSQKLSGANADAMDAIRKIRN